MLYKRHLLRDRKSFLGHLTKRKWELLYNNGQFSTEVHLLQKIWSVPKRLSGNSQKQSFWPKVWNHPIWKRPSKPIKPDVGVLITGSICFQGHGLEIETWSDLPVGSGMGTSSILAGCVLSALWTAVGTKYSLSDLNHAVMIEIIIIFIHPLFTQVYHKFNQSILDINIT